MEKTKVKFQSIVRHAYTTTPFYINIAEEKNINIDSIIENERYEMLPVITKDMIAKDNDALISAHALMEQIKGELIPASTSGTTGTIINVFWRNNDYNRAMLPLWFHRYKKYKVMPNDEMCFFYTSHSMDTQNVGNVQYKNQWGFSKNNLDLNRMESIIYNMYQIQPKWFQMQPSIVKMMIHVMKIKMLPPIRSLQYIEVTGERISRQEIESIEKYFQVSVCNQYGCNEATSIGLQENGKYFKIFKENVLIEIIENGKIQPDGQEGDIVITSLQNYATPFVRYNLGDRGIFRIGGSGKRELELVGGRKGDWIKCQDGSEINAYVLKNVIDTMNACYQDVIVECQMIQKKLNKIEVRLVIEKGILSQDKLEKEFIMHIADERLKKFHYTFVYSQQLENQNKHLFFSRNLC